MLFKSRLFFGIFKMMFGAIFGVLYKLIAFFNLQYTALSLLIGLVLFVTGVFEKNPTIELVFQLIVILSVVYAIVSTIKKLLRIDKKVKKSKGAQIQPLPEEPPKQANQTSQANQVEESSLTAPPKYYRIKGNQDYVMAEYSDKYELYKISDGKLVKVRTDYK